MGYRGLFFYCLAINSFVIMKLGADISVLSFQGDTRTVRLGSSFDTPSNIYIKIHNPLECHFKAFHSNLQLQSSIPSICMRYLIMLILFVQFSRYSNSNPNSDLTPELFTTGQLLDPKFSYITIHNSQISEPPNGGKNYLKSLDIYLI